MYRLLAVFCFAFAAVFSLLDFPNGALSMVVVSVLALVGIALIRRLDMDVDFLIAVFVGGLLARLFLGGIIFYFDLFDFFGPDAKGYDEIGFLLSQGWNGTVTDSTEVLLLRMSGAGWGMNYLVGGLYYTFGRSILLGQSFCAVFGAAIAPLIYFCAFNIFENRRVARYSAVLIAFFPSFVVWTAQFLKDGLIIFFIVLAITSVIELQKRFNLVSVLLIAVSLGGILSLRFYIFYLVCAAVVGCFVLGQKATQVSIVGRMGALLLLGVLLTYFSVLQTATDDLDKFGNLDRIEISRLGASMGSGSGYIDRESVQLDGPIGLITAIPVGLLYLLLAPFPWQAINFRQATTIPETLLWWSVLPLAVWGLWFTIRYRARKAIPTLIFTILLTLVYSVYQGNVGTAYRQRTQIQVFLFMFVAVGLTMYLERREDRIMLARARNQRKQ